MRGSGSQPGTPSGMPGTPSGMLGTPPQSASDAVAMVMSGLGWLADADMASMPASVQADCLRGLE